VLDRKAYLLAYFAGDDFIVTGNDLDGNAVFAKRGCKI